ncbi:MAG TPA: four helix bundle protein [Terriglobales bacterium]|nr:four helix bundle protein [Terriglobales bacterium]
MSYSYRDLVAWQRAKDLSVAVYRATAVFPKSELYGLTSQIRRASISVFSNIAEGQGRISKGEFQQFLGHACGSLLELRSQLEVSVDLGFLPSEDFKKLDDIAAHVLRLINGLIDSLRSKSKAASGSS